MTKPVFETNREAKAAGWFSRRHETREAHEATRENYQKNHGKAGRIRRLLERGNS